MISGDDSELIKATEIDWYVLERGNGETPVPGENHQPTGRHRKSLSHNVVSSTPRLSGIRTPSVSSDRQ